MARPQITIDVKAVTQQAQRALQAFGRVVAGLAAGALAALFASLVRIAPELVKLSLASDRARESLSALTDSRADEFIKAIQDASLGTISAIDAMSIANRALFMGVVTTTDEMAKLVEVSIALGRVQGLDATTALNDATTAIARQSKMIADNLGIIIDMDRVTESNNKQQEFLNQFLEEGNELLAIQGGLVADDAAEFEKFGANVKDAKTELGDMLAEAILPTVRALNDLHDGLQKVRDDLALAENEAAKGGASFEEYVQALNDAGIVSDNVNEAVQTGNIRFQQQGIIIRELRKDYDEIQAAREDASSAALEHMETMRREAAQVDVLAKSVGDLSDALEKRISSLDALNDMGDAVEQGIEPDFLSFFEPFEQATDAATEAAQGLTGGTEQVAAEGSGLDENALTDYFWGQVKSMTDDPAILIPLGLALGKLTAREVALMEELNRLAILAARGQLSTSELSALSGVLANPTASGLAGVAAGRSAPAPTGDPALGSGTTRVPFSSDGAAPQAGGLLPGGAGGDMIEVHHTHSIQLTGEGPLTDAIADDIGAKIDQAMNGTSRVGPATAPGALPSAQPGF